ncbi:flavin reductase family protein [Acidisoma sp.]|uniref:flavin reductase family protein n=1 Tax=Acidisoma sp. TaxID=1872115 RepID=UPI003AFFC232
MSVKNAEIVIDLADSGPTPREFRNALARFATGVTVITTRSPSGKAEGLTANSFSSVSLDPPLVLWSLREGAPSMASFTDSGCFAINVLGADQQHHSRHFATASADKFHGQSWIPGLGGCPLLEDCVARFECHTEQIISAGDHRLFIGLVLRATYRPGEPLVFHAGAYHGVAPLLSVITPSGTS